MRALAAAGLVLGVALMAAPLVLPRLGVLVPVPEGARAAGGFSPTAGARAMISGVSAVSHALAAAPPAAQAQAAAAPDLPPLPQVKARRSTAPGAKFVKVER